MGLALEGLQQLRGGSENDAKTISYRMVIEGQSAKKAKMVLEMGPAV